MLLRIKDIPIEGKNIAFELNNESLNSRISISSQPEYSFEGIVPCEINLRLQGTMLLTEGVLIDGLVRGKFTTICSRCGDKVSEQLETPIKMVLKPAKSRGDELEDLNFGYYDGEVVNCAEIAEEMLVLALPMVVRCKTGGCAESKDSWVFGEEEPVNNPFKNIKIVH